MPYRISVEESNVKLERGESLEPRVVSDSLNESCNDSAVGIGTFCHIERCDSQRHTMEMFKPTLGSLPVERPTVRSIAY